jgi:hypothetical protein
VFARFTQDDVERLKSLRPYPSYFAIIGQTAGVNEIMKLLDDDGELLQKPEKWHLLFTDGKFDEFTYAEKYPTISYLTMNDNICCRGDFSLASMERIVNFVVTTFAKYRLPFIIMDDDECGSKGKLIKTDYQELVNELENGENGFYRQEGSNRFWYHTELFMRTMSENKSQALANTAKIINGIVVPLDGSAVRKAKRYFRIGTTESVPWAYVTEDPITHDLVWEGYCIDFMKKLSEMMNFDFEIVTPKQGRNGKRKNNDKWDGLIGDLGKFPISTFSDISKLLSISI